MAERKCQGKTKAGKACKAAPLKPGTVIDGVEVFGDHCRAHDPDLPSSTRFGSTEHAQKFGPLGGRPRAPRVIDILRERAEERAEEILEVYFGALDASKPIAVGSGQDMMVEYEPDHATRLRAAEAIHDRSYGKPRQEITGADGAPLQLEVTGAAIVNDPKARKHAAELRRRVASTRPKQPGGSRSRN